MEHRRCGNSDLILPVLGVGCWAFGGGDYWGEQDQRDVEAVVGRALDAGCNYFDTAELYNGGASESALGTALGARRHEAIIGTKVNPSNAYASTMAKHCEASLKRLGTDYIDLYMVHWPLQPGSIRHFTTDESVINNPPQAAEAFEMLMKLREQGKIRYIGVSNFGVNRFAEARNYAEIAVNQLPYSLLTRAVEYEALPYCRNIGVGVIGCMTLLQGLLSGTYNTLSDVPVWQRRTRHFDSRGTQLCRHGGCGFEQETDQTISSIKSIAIECGMTLPEIAIKWAIANSDISCALVGARNGREVDINARTAQEPLSAEVVERLNSATSLLMQKLGLSFDYYESEENDRTR